MKRLSCDEAIEQLLESYRWELESDDQFLICELEQVNGEDVEMIRENDEELLEIDSE